MRSASILFVFCAASLTRADPAPIQTIADVPYGPDEQQKLDIYLPPDATAPRPAVLWIHGGGWSALDKREGYNGISTLADALAARGFVAISCNYRLAPAHRYPAQLQDVQRVVRWLRMNADRYHIDPKRIGAAGVSAGGHLAAMLAVRETLSRGDDLDRFSSRVRAAVCISGPTDLREGRPDLGSPVLTGAVQTLIGDNPTSAIKLREDASPILFVDKDSAPLLFIVGADDTWVPPAHSRLMAKALKARSVDADVVTIEGKGHELLPQNSPRAQDALLRWFEKQLQH